MSFRLVLCLLQSVAPPSTFDDVHELRFSGPGPVRVDLEPAFSGRLHLWTRSDLDLAIEVSDRAGNALGADDDSGGAETPYLELDVAPGDRLVVHVDSSGPGECELVCIAAPETAATRAVATLVRERSRELVDLIESGGGLAAEKREAHDRIAALLAELRAVEGGATSGLVGRMFWELHLHAYDLEDEPLALDALRDALAHRERTYPPTHRGLLGARRNFAGLCALVGDVAPARRVLQRLVEDLEGFLPREDASLVEARYQLAGTLFRLGDMLRARAILEDVLALRERALVADHREVLNTKELLGHCLHELGELEEARVLEEDVLQARLRTLPDDHPDVQLARMHLAGSIKQLGEVGRARELEERALAALERVLPPDHPEVVGIRMNLADTLARSGDHRASLALLEEVVPVLARIHAAGHPAVVDGKRALALARLAQGDAEGAHALLEDLVALLRWRAELALSLSPREARRLVWNDAPLLAAVVLLCRSADERAWRELVEVVETRRLTGTATVPPAGRFEAGDSLAPFARSAAAARAELGALLADRASFGSTDTRRFEELVEERDRAERTIRTALVERGLVRGSIDAEDLARALPPDGAAVGLLRHGGLRVEGGAVVEEEDGYLAHVLRPDGRLEILDVGSARVLEVAVREWRVALGSSGSARGLASAARDVVDAELLGQRLREGLVDPLLRAAGPDARTLFVCPDDAALLVPLDALPLEGGNVGDRVRIVVQTSFADLLRPPRLPRGEPVMLLTGAVAYGDGGAFAPLPATEREVRAVAATFARAHERQATLVLGEEATRPAVVGGVAGARYVHLATHGWFAPAQWLDPDAGGRAWTPMALGQRVTDAAPLALAGLALAGANADPSGGILTAEELAAADLSRCDLAVLSACETNVGLSDEGAGLQSLRTALHAAGARSAVTSLWQVDDEATRELMTRFYRYLWVEGLDKADALWRAKCDLRDAGRPVRDWGAWVLSGDPR